MHTLRLNVILEAPIYGSDGISYATSWENLFQHEDIIFSFVVLEMYKLTTLNLLCHYFLFVFTGYLSFFVVL